jgi:cell division protein FtsN
VARSASRAGSRLKRRRNRRRGSTGLPRGFAMGMLLIVSTGLLAWYFRSALMTTLESPPRVIAVESDQARKPSGKATVKSTSKPATEQAPKVTEPTERFEFYDMLPDAEVEVAEQPKAVRSAAPPPVSVPGTYVVQAGAYPDFAAADKVKARLALLGVASEIQTADSNGVLFNRVRIGPIENLDELNRLRARLQQNGIEHQVIPVGE